MKTIEEKARAYDEAIKKAAALYKASEPMSGCNVIIETLFPELAESEDEKIRKAIIEGLREMKSSFHTISSIKIDDAIAWLEKQEGCEYIKKDWLEHIKQSWYKEGFIDGKYSGGTSKEWTINDAATLKELIDFLENGTAKLQHDLTRYANWLKNQFTPIEKQGEQKASYTTIEETGNGGINALVTLPIEMKTAEESLGVDSETYNKIIDECILGEQKPEDKIEDEEYNGEDYGIDSLYHAQRILEKTLGKVDGYQTDDGILSHKCAITAVKKLYEQKPAWSEEDEELLKWSINNLTELKDRFGEEYGKVGKCIDWVKSLKGRVQPQNHWKPSVEQIASITCAVRKMKESACYDSELVSLFNDLKKLKG